MFTNRKCILNCAAAWSCGSYCCHFSFDTMDPYTTGKIWYISFKHTNKLNLTKIWPVSSVFTCFIVSWSFILYFSRVVCVNLTKHNQCFFRSILFIAFKHISCVPIQGLHPSGVAFEDQFLRLHPTWPTKDPTGDTRIHTQVKKLKSYLCSSKEVTMRR